MHMIREILHEKRKATEVHIQQRRQAGEQTVRYTAMMPDVPFLVLGLASDAGWIAHLAAEVRYLCRNGLHLAADWFALAAMAALVCGVVCLVWLNRIHEKEIATRRQKNLSFGLTAFAGLAGAAAGILQRGAGASPELAWVIAGGLLNFAAGLPIFLSFKKGIFYGVK